MKLKYDIPVSIKDALCRNMRGTFVNIKSIHESLSVFL